jgi:hypothetical protein
MKNIFTVLTLFLLSIFCCAAQDTICLSADRLARIADTIVYLRQYERYSLVCDSALQQAKNWGNTVYRQKQEAEIQAKDLMLINNSLFEQLGKQKALSNDWQKQCEILDEKLQKQKKGKRIGFGVFGGVVLALTTTVITVLLLK